MLLWELFSRGATPYIDVTNWEIRDYLSSGLRLFQPEQCQDEMYVVGMRNKLIESTIYDRSYVYMRTAQYS